MFIEIMKVTKIFNLKLIISNMIKGENIVHAIVIISIIYKGRKKD